MYFQRELQFMRLGNYILCKMHLFRVIRFCKLVTNRITKMIVVTGFSVIQLQAQMSFNNKTSCNQKLKCQTKKEKKSIIAIKSNLPPFVKNEWAV